MLPDCRTRTGRVAVPCRRNPHLSVIRARFSTFEAVLRSCLPPRGRLPRASTSTTTPLPVRVDALFPSTNSWRASIPISETQYSTTVAHCWWWRVPAPEKLVYSPAVSPTSSGHAGSAPFRSWPSRSPTKPQTKCATGWLPWWVRWPSGCGSVHSTRRVCASCAVMRIGWDIDQVSPSTTSPTRSVWCNLYYATSISTPRSFRPEPCMPSSVPPRTIW